MTAFRLAGGVLATRFSPTRLSTAFLALPLVLKMGILELIFPLTFLQGTAYMKSISWKAILTSFPVWALFLAAFARDSMLVVLTAIMPQYYSDVYSMNPAYVGLCSTLPPLGMSVMIVVGGVASDFLLKRGIKKTALRKLLVCFGGVIQGLCIGALYFTDRWRLAVALFSVASFGGFATAGYPPMFYDMAPKYTSVLADLAQSGFVGGILTSVLAAQLPGKSRSLSTWQTFYLIVGLVQFLIALLFFLMADSTRQPWADSDVTSTTSSLRPSEGRDVTSSHRSPGDGISQGGENYLAVSESEQGGKKSEVCWERVVLLRPQGPFGQGKLSVFPQYGSVVVPSLVSAEQKL